MKEVHRCYTRIILLCTVLGKGFQTIDLMRAVLPASSIDNRSVKCAKKVNKFEKKIGHNLHASLSCLRGGGVGRGWGKVVLILVLNWNFQLVRIKYFTSSTNLFEFFVYLGEVFLRYAIMASFFSARGKNKGLQK